jgi:hypothetical protein
MGTAFSSWEPDELGPSGEAPRAKPLVHRREVRWETQGDGFHAVIGRFTVCVERGPEPDSTWEWSAFSQAVCAGPRALRSRGWPHAGAAQRDAEVTLARLL